MKDRTYSGIPVLRQFVGSRPISRTAAAASAAPIQEKAFAFLADTGTVSLPDGGPFPLAGGLYSDGGFRWDPSWVTIERAGRYLAVFTVSGRADTAPLPKVGLALESGETIGAPARLLAAEDGSAQATGSAVVETDAAARLCLRTDGPLLITGTPAVTLTLIREV